MKSNRLTAADVLSAPVTFPNDEAEAGLARLVGLDSHIEALCRNLRLIFDPSIVEAWSEKHYRTMLPAAQLVSDAVPLIVFECDVGTGKTALAEVIGQRVAVDGGYGVHLVKMSTQVRGTGYVGEMGTLLAESFKRVNDTWAKHGEPLILMIDEADSLLTTREASQHHHEDKSGVNTILQHLDQLRANQAQVAVIAITNRVHIIDPAIHRRATAVFSFNRPSECQRKELFERLFAGAFEAREIDRLVEASRREKSISGPVLQLTYSDLTLRFAIPALREAVWHDRPLEVLSLAKMLEGLAPTPAAAATGNTKEEML